MKSIILAQGNISSLYSAVNTWLFDHLGYKVLSITYLDSEHFDSTRFQACIWYKID